MSWRLSAQFIESCSCNLMCPCWFGVPDLAVNDQGWCGTAAAFRVREGQSDGVDLGRRTVVWASYFPGNIFEGGGTSRLYFDDGASAAQRAALEGIFQGKSGGPMEALSGLMSTWLPSQARKMAVSEEGDSITIAVDGVGEVKSQRLRGPTGEPTRMQGAAMSLGFQMETVDIAPSASRWADPDMPRAYETRSGAVGSLTWSG